MLKFIVKFLKALNSNSHPGEIAHAVCLGMLLGFLPKDNIFWYIITVFVLFMRINKGALVLSTLGFSLLAPLFDSLFDSVGYWFLTLPALEPTLPGCWIFLLSVLLNSITQLLRVRFCAAWCFTYLFMLLPVYLSGL